MRTTSGRTYTKEGTPKYVPIWAGSLGDETVAIRPPVARRQMATESADRAENDLAAELARE